ncbi:MAG: chromosome segregation protein SMC, partial [Bacteroidetes bacterium]|nr:chromosome segregation protein SMC [Bacteroidota bacterium]
VQNLRGKENDKNLAQQKLQFLKEKETGLQSFLEKAEGQLKTIGDSIEFTQLQVGEEESSLQDLQDRVETSKMDIEDKRQIFDESRSGVDAIRGQFQQIQRSQFDAEKKVAVADTSIQNLQRAQLQLSDEKQNRLSQIDQLTIELGEKETTLEAKRIDLQQLQDQHEKTKELIFETQAQMEGLRNELAEESRKLDARRNEFALLKSLIDSMEGYPESIKFLHKNPNWNHQAPILSDIIYVTEIYRTAVENVLEPYLNYYVVNNLQEGLQAVHLLDDNKKGKANFFLLEKFNDIKVETHQPANTIKALDVIEVDAQYQKLAEYLLGNVYIAENEEAIVNSNGAIVLEKTGKYVKGKYTLTGGSVGLFEGKKIGRAKNLEKLQDEIILQDAVVNALKAEIKLKHNEVITFNEQLKENSIKQTENEINQLTNQLFAARNKHENLLLAQQTGQQRLEDIELRLQDEQDAIAETRESLLLLNEQMQATTNEMQVVEQAYQLAEQEYNYASVQYNDINLQLTRQQSKINGLKQELVFKENQLNDLHFQIQNNTTQLAEASSNIAQSEQALVDVQAELLELLRLKEIEEKLLNEADQAYYNLRNALQEKESALRMKVKSKEMLDHLVSEIKDRLNELKLQLAGMKERLSVEFRVELDDIIAEPRNTDTSLEELQSGSDRMKKRLENMGEINPTAIEAYTEMKKRYEFILEQKNDLVSAKDSLLQTIQEVEATANQQFLDTFNKVRENFQKVFKALFSEEDTADMILVDPTNLAETGIDIVAKPKGKRPSSITQLSGGEKTLTATALLFSIYLIKPAPFCILDEVDAPLDDANVGKFTQMIKKFSDNSQFIIVTHNKQTMSAVDVIYGVTMQEPGVSKLVPVDFRSLAN